MKNKNFLSGLNSKLANFKICSKIRIWLLIPLVIVLVAVIVVAVVGGTAHSITEGLNIGIDFEGGTIVSVKFGEGSYTSNENYDENKKTVIDKIESYGVRVSIVQSSEASVRDNSAITFRYKNISRVDSEIAKLNNEIKIGLREIFPEHAEEPDFILTESIGATASSELLTKAALALLISTLLILIYIIFRFEAVSGVAAVLTLIHDVIIMFSLTVICRIQINSSFVAAVITIIAYAINNTIIVFDRSRELIAPIKDNKSIPYENIGDKAIKDTLTRQVYTTITTLVTVAFLAIFGGPTIREFTIPIIIGLFVGFYSSIFVATPIWSKLSYVAEGIRIKRGTGRKTVTYETLDKQGNIIEEEVVKEKIEKKPKANSTYKYKKGKTTFKNKK